MAGRCARVMRMVGVMVAAMVVGLWCNQATAWTPYRTPDGSRVLRWWSSPVAIQLDTTESNDVSFEAGMETVQTGFMTWSGHDCDGQPGELAFDWAGAAPGEVGFDESDGATNQNLVIWVLEAADWRHGTAVSALTSITYDTGTGQIVDTDLEINDAGFSFSTAPEQTQLDLLSTVVHEAGHVLGLDHSAIELATMYWSTLPGETHKATLLDDDIEGYCALYAEGAELNPTPPETGDATSTVVEGETGGDSGCTFGPASRPHLPGLLTLLLSMAFLRVRMRRSAPGHRR